MAYASRSAFSSLAFWRTPMRVNARVASSTVSRSSMTAVSMARGLPSASASGLYGAPPLPQVKELCGGEGWEAGVVTVVVLEVGDAELAAAVPCKLGEKAHGELGLAHA